MKFSNVNYGGPTVLFALPKAIEVALASFDTGLFLYLGGMFVALSLPLPVLAKRLLLAEGGVLVFSIGAIASRPLSLASIVALDRGNSIGFALPHSCLVCLVVCKWKTHSGSNCGWIGSLNPPSVWLAVIWASGSEKIQVVFSHLRLERNLLLA